MIDREREKEEDPQETPTVEHLVGMLRNAVLSGPQFLRDFCVRRAKRIAIDLQNRYRYVGALKTRIFDALGELDGLSLEQRKEAFKLIDEVLT